jgi:hypothetical protein
MNGVNMPNVGVCFLEFHDDRVDGLKKLKRCSSENGRYSRKVSSNLLQFVRLDSKRLHDVDELAGRHLVEE